MTTIEKIRAEIEETQKNTIDWSRSAGLIDALEIIDKYAEQEPTSPCDLCKYNPPSSCDGKPCTMCQAEKEPQESEEISERNMKMWEEIFKAEREGKK